MKLLELPDALKNRRLHGFFEDFQWYVTAHLLSLVATDSGTAAVGDAAGGVITLNPSDGTVADNDEVYLKTANELFLFAADKPLVFEARLKWAEANTDDANVCLGVMDAVAANSILDDGGGPKASYSGAVFFKVDGGTTWNFETSLGGTQVTTALPDYPAGGANWQTLRIEAREQGGVVEIVPFIDGQQCLDVNGRRVKHTITLGSPTEMNAFVGAKNGGANQESILVDYLAAYQLR
jgi:hypothetical protein